MDTAIRWLTASADQGNQFAQYALGKLYFYDGDVPRDKEKSLYWLRLSAAQGNIYAQYLIDNIGSYRNPSVLLAATRLMHRLENLFREDYHRTAGIARNSAHWPTRSRCVLIRPDNCVKRIV